MNTIFAGSNSLFWVITIILVLTGVAGFSILGTNQRSQVLTDHLSEPLDGAVAAEVDIHAGDGNLTIDSLAGGEQMLASGTLQYLENKGLPIRSLSTNRGQAIFTLKSGGKGQPWLHFPWSACNGATEWHIHLNPGVRSAITAHSDGGNVKLDLAGISVTRVNADTGGGNIDVTLPDSAANLSVTAKTGAGNVTVEIGSGTTGSSAITAASGAGTALVRLPVEIAARIHASSGMGKVIVDSRFSKVDDKTYESPDYDSAPDKVEITVSSGAGNVIISPKEILDR